MPIQNYLLPALDHVLDWDLPDEACGQALSNQAGLLAGAASDQGSWDNDL